MRRVVQVYELPIEKVGSFIEFFSGEIFENDEQAGLFITENDKPGYVQVELHAEADIRTVSSLHIRARHGWWIDFAQYVKNSAIPDNAVYVLSDSLIAPFLERFKDSELSRVARVEVLPIPNTNSFEVLVSAQSFASFLLEKSVTGGMLSVYKESLRYLFVGNKRYLVSDGKFSEANYEEKL
jgi:hypothetical protein